MDQGSLIYVVFWVTAILNTRVQYYIYGKKTNGAKSLDCSSIFMGLGTKNEFV